MGGGEEKKKTYPCWHFVLSFRRQFTVLAIELVKGVKVVDQTDVVALHDNTGGNDNAPGDGLGIGLDPL